VELLINKTTEHKRSQTKPGRTRQQFPKRRGIGFKLQAETNLFFQAPLNAGLPILKDLYPDRSVDYLRLIL
jgi:hypothetical protein